MTWLKLSDDFADECVRAGLSADAFRTHVEGLLWTMRRETAGRIDTLDVRRFAESRQADVAIAELVKVGFWSQTHDGWVIEHHMEVQVQPEDLRRQRLVAAERQRRARQRKTEAALQAIEVDESRVTSRVTSRRDDESDSGRDWAGLDRKPLNYVAPKKGEEDSAPEVEDEDWPRLPPRCAVCSGVLDATLVAAGDTTHPTCE